MADNAANATSGIIFLIIYLAIFVFYIAASWKIFTKAGQPGWASLIPFYNIYLLLKIIYRPWWWLLLFFVPLLNIVISILVSLDLAKVFGKSTVFGIVGLWLFSFVGYPMLAFGKAQYIGIRKTQTPAQNPQQLSTPTAAPAMQQQPQMAAPVPPQTPTPPTAQ